MAIGIRERAAEFLTGPSRGPSSGSESLPITTYLRNPQRILFVPGPHIEDVILLEPFAYSVKDCYPDTHLVLITPDRFSSLAEEITCIDRIITTTIDENVKNSRELERLSAEFEKASFDVALALTFEVEPIVAELTAHSGASLKIGFEEMDGKGVSLNVLLRESDRNHPYQRRIEILFSLLGVGRKSHFDSSLTRWRREGINSLDYLRDKHGEHIIGFYFDQVDSLDRLREVEIERTVRVIIRRRNEKSILSGYGLNEKRFQSLMRDGARIVEKNSLVDLIALFSDCSWVVTNSLGFSVLMGKIGSRVVFLGKPSRLKKFSLNRLSSVTFLPVISGKVLQDSLVRIMEEKYPGE